MTKQEIMVENARLESENEQLKSEIRQAKSASLEVEAMRKQITDYEEQKQENEKLNASIKDLKKQNEIQTKQLGTLLNGLNEMNQAVGKLFEHLDYMLGLAKENFNNTTAKLQNNLNKIMEDSNGNSNNNEEV